MQYYIPKRVRKIRQKKSDEIVMNIKRTILSGKYSPGDKLPTERELSLKYNVSRIPVREAIAQLVKENIVRTESNVGNFITESCDSHLLSHSIYQFSHIDKKLLRDSLLTRQLLESQCARLAAKNATREEIEQIQTFLFSSTSEFTRLKSNESNKFLKEDYNFHISIAKASHSDHLYKYMEIITETISTHQFSSLQNDPSIYEVPNAHFKIYNAILARNEDLAANEMHNHLQRVIDLIESTLL